MDASGCARQGEIFSGNDRKSPLTKSRFDSSVKSLSKKTDLLNVVTGEEKIS
jgi:hypothetical protein